MSFLLLLYLPGLVNAGYRNRVETEELKSKESAQVDFGFLSKSTLKQRHRSTKTELFLPASEKSRSSICSIVW